MSGIFEGMVAIGAECADEVKAAAGIGLIPVVPIAIVADVAAVRISIVCRLTLTALALLWFININTCCEKECEHELKQMTMNKLVGSDDESENKEMFERTRNNLTWLGSMCPPLFQHSTNLSVSFFTPTPNR